MVLTGLGGLSLLLEIRHSRAFDVLLFAVFAVLALMAVRNVALLGGRWLPWGVRPGIKFKLASRHEAAG